MFESHLKFKPRVQYKYLKIVIMFQYGLHFLGGREKTGKMEQFISG